LGQRINRGSFAYYDYGVKRNLKIYGQTEPPNYDLSKIDLKYIVLMSGLNDILADQKDVELLRRQLTGINGLTFYQRNQY
jgi:lysosomal acid lipase/cholesteryl ester hydrolase